MPTHSPPVKRRLAEFGPALLAVLTWLGPGDIIEATVAGGNYGYTLLWVLAIAVLMRFFMVSMISKYHLCNSHGEGILEGLRRLHSAIPVFLGVASAFMAHAYCSYMTAAMGELGAAYFGAGSKLFWAIMFAFAALLFVIRPTYRRLLLFFRACFVVLVLTVFSAAIWCRPSASAIAMGLAGLAIPKNMGAFSALLVALSASGAITGSVSNFIYPHLLQERGWTKPEHRRPQQLDLIAGLSFLFLFNLSLWIIGATQLHPDQKQVSSLIEIPLLLKSVLGETGPVIMAVGLAAAVFTSLVGFAHCLGGLADRCFALSKSTRSAGNGLVYHVVSVSAVICSVFWSLPGMPGALQLALSVNCAQIILVPVLALSVWILTAQPRFIGETAKNRWWENGIMALLLFLSVYGALGSIHALISQWM